MDEKKSTALYKNHIETIFGIKKIEDFSDEEVENAFNVLLQILPNNGKLYKYRSFENNKFENYYSALKNGYLWFPKADNLNDDFDTVLYFDPVQEAKNIRNYLLANPRLYFRAIVKYGSKPVKIGFTKLDNDAFHKVIDCYDLNSGELDRNKAVVLLSKMGIRLDKTIRFLNEVDEFVEKFMRDNEDLLEETVKNFVNINTTIRRDSNIYSMSETYKSNPLWAFYANNNQGFCIEYDFNKAKKFDIEKKKLLLNTYKIIYSDKVDDYSFVKILQYILTGKQDDKLYLEANLDLFSQLMTKQADWSFEKEWRIMLCNLEDCKVYLDLVSKIIIDERILETKESKQLINLCKQKRWGVLIRKTQYINVAHEFEKLI